MQRVSALLPSWDRRKQVKRLSVEKALRSLPFSFNSSPTTASSTDSDASHLKHSPQPRIAREAFWPSTLDKECDKAASIVKSFCTDGCLAPVDESATGALNDLSSQPQTRITKKIPSRIIQNAAAIAVFTCMRSGLWMTGSGGSGILIARKADGTWSPPSGIMLHTPVLSFIFGVDIYDCVLVVNNLAALESITKPKVVLGEDVGLTAGPLTTVGTAEQPIAWKDLGNTVFTYMKARGQLQSVDLNGCILTERANENHSFYASPASTMEILAGNVARHVDETQPLFEVIKAAEGRSDFDKAIISAISANPAPGDAMILDSPIVSPLSARSFGVPDFQDPDPFGVLALEMAGLEIREAGSRLRPASSQFDFAPNPTSPIFATFHRQSVDTTTSFRNSSRTSHRLSTKTSKSQMADASTQTTPSSPARSEVSKTRSSIDKPSSIKEYEEVDYTQIDLTPLRKLSNPLSLGGETVIDSPVITGLNSTTQASLSKPRFSIDDHDAGSRSNLSQVSTQQDDDSTQNDHNDLQATKPETTGERTPDDPDDSDADDDDEDDHDDDDDEEPVIIYEVASTVQRATITTVSTAAPTPTVSCSPKASSTVDDTTITANTATTTPPAIPRIIQAKGSLVTIKRPPPPPLPSRNPARSSRDSKSDAALQQIAAGIVAVSPNVSMSPPTSGHSSARQSCDNTNIPETITEHVPISTSAASAFSSDDSSDDDDFTSPIQSPLVTDDIDTPRTTRTEVSDDKDVTKATVEAPCSSASTIQVS